MAKKEQSKEVKKDIGKYAALESVKNSEGGQILITSLLSDMASSVDFLSSKYTSATHIELIASCAKLSERLALYRTLIRATKNKKLASLALEELLSEPDE